MSNFVDYSNSSALFNGYATAINKKLTQVITMPTAAADLVGKVVQYIGVTGTYTNGYFYKCVSIEGDPVTYDWVQINVQPTGGEYSPSYANKTAVHMGDSWVELYNIAELAAEKVGYTVINMGFQATTISNVVQASHAREGADKFSLIKLAQAIENNTWTEQDAVAAEYPQWAAKLAVLKALDWSTVDILILSYGVNDFSFQSTPGDTEARDIESVCGALKTAIGILEDLNHNMEIIVTTPCLRYENPNNENMSNFTSYMYLQDEYRNAIGLTAKECGVKLVDMRAISGINEANRSVTLLSDNLHPTVLGQQLWAEAFAKSLECGYAGAFDTDVFNIDKDKDNLCDDSEKYIEHKKWNASFVSDGVKYLCTRATQQYKNMILGQAYFNSIPTGSVIKLQGYGKKIGSQNHRIGFFIYNADKTSQLLEKYTSAISNTTDSAIEYSFTTEVNYTNCWVIFYVKQMSTWENGKALVRDMKCTVTLPSSDIDDKADKVSGATAGNFAGLDASGNLTDSGKKASDFATASHNQASNTINAMTGYTKASTAAAVAATDTLNEAIGKLEKTLDGKGTSNLAIGTTAGTACEGNDSRLSDSRTPTAHNQAASTITAGTLAGRVQANATAAATLANAQVRDITISTTDLTPNSSSLATGSVYIVYE